NTTGNRLSLLNTGSVVQVRSDADGGGTVLPLAFFVATEAMRIDTSLQVGIGTTTPSSQLHVSGTTAIIRFDRYATGAGNGAAFIGRHANGTPASPTQTLSGDDIAAFVARGYGATGFVGGGAAVKGLAAQDFTDTVGGMHLVFSSNPNGGLTLTEVMRLTQAQHLLIGTTTDDGINRLQVSGSISATKRSFNVVTYTSGTTTIASTDFFVIADATSGNVTLNLPAANAMGAGKTAGLRIKRKDSTGNTVTISRAGSDTIDGGTSTTLAAPASKDFESDGVSAWYIL